MAHSEISICNRALLMLGASAITSLADETDAASICNTVYGALRDATIAGHPWRFAMEKAVLTREAVTPPNEWTYQFAIPPTALNGTVNAIFESATAQTAVVDYEIFGRKILSDLPALWADYMVRAPEANWPDTFALFMVYALAADIAYAITDQTGVAERMHEKAYGSPGEGGLGGQLAVALATEAQSAGSIGVEADAFVNARAGA